MFTNRPPHVKYREQYFLLSPPGGQDFLPAIDDTCQVNKPRETRPILTLGNLYSNIRQNYVCLGFYDRGILKKKLHKVFETFPFGNNYWKSMKFTSGIPPSIDIDIGMSIDYFSQWIFAGTYTVPFYLSKYIFFFGKSLYLK